MTKNQLKLTHLTEILVNTSFSNHYNVFKMVSFQTDWHALMHAEQQQWVLNCPCRKINTCFVVWNYIK